MKYMFKSVNWIVFFVLFLPNILLAEFVPVKPPKSFLDLQFELSANEPDPYDFTVKDFVNNAYNPMWNRSWERINETTWLLKLTMTNVITGSKLSQQYFFVKMIPQNIVQIKKIINLNYGSEETLSPEETLSSLKRLYAGGKRVKSEKLERINSLLIPSEPPKSFLDLQFELSTNKLDPDHITMRDFLNYGFSESEKKSWEWEKIDENTWLLNVVHNEPNFRKYTFKKIMPQNIVQVIKIVDSNTGKEVFPAIIVKIKYHNVKQSLEK